MTAPGNPPLPLALAHLLEATSDAVFTLDREGRITYLNPRAAAIASLPPQEVIGLHLERDLPHVFSPRWLTESRRALAEQRPVKYDAFNPALGEWVRVSIVPSPAGLAVQIRNVTAARRAQALQGVTAALSQARTPAQVADVLLEQAVAAAGAYMGALFVPGGNDTQLKLRGQVGYSPELLGRFAQLPLSLDLPLCDAARRQEPVFVSGDALEQAYPDSAGVRAERTHSLAALPLKVDGSLWGVLVLSFEETRRFRTDEREFVQSLVEQCAQALGRTRTEAELRSRQAQLRVVLETAGLGHWELDLRTHEAQRTPRHDEIFGYAGGHPHWTYETFLDHVLPEERAAIDRHYRTALERGDPWDFECRVRRADGEVRWIWARGQVLPEGEASGHHMLGLVQDITERKQSEEQLRVQADTLETVNRIGRSLAAELDLGRLVQAVTDAGVELTRAQFGAFFYNVENERQETYTLYTLSGVPREAFASFPMPRNTQIFGPTFAGEGVIRSPDITQDPRYGHNAPYAGMPAGHLPVRSYLAVPVISRAGEVLGGLFFGHAQPGVFSEQAEQVTLGLASQTAVALDNARLYQQLQHSHAALERRVEERTRQLEEQARELRRSNAELEQFAYIASHDLQAPIRAVTSFAGLIAHRYGGQLDERGQRYLEQIVGNGEHMKRLVDDLLAFSRLHTQQRVPQATDSAAALQDVLRRLRPDLDLLGAQMTPGPLPTVLVDAQQLDQLLQNLISNALKYRREDTPPRVSVTAERAGPHWQFAVADNGIGIEAHYHERIFVIFQRLHGREKYEGTGIGLAVCKKIVERHGGRLWLESTPGQGSTFYFTLPTA